MRKAQSRRFYLADAMVVIAAITADLVLIRIGVRLQEVMNLPGSRGQAPV
jgi:hypothetical protein